MHPPRGHAARSSARVGEDDPVGVTLVGKKGGARPADFNVACPGPVHVAAGGWICALPQPDGLRWRSVAAGKRARAAGGRIGRRTSSPPQFGQIPASLSAAQVAQKVHSNEQILASCESGGRSRSQHSQFGLSFSIALSTFLVR
jgi:hypothetical protein